MTAEQFMKIIADLPQEGDMVDVLQKRLERLSLDELIEFQKHLDAAKCSRIHHAVLDAGSNEPD